MGGKGSGGARTTTRTNAKRRGPKPQAAALRRMAALLQEHAAKMTDAELRAWEDALNSVLVWIELEYMRRADLDEEEE